MHLRWLKQGRRVANLTSSHLTLILSVVRYSLSWIRFNYHATWAVLSYRLTFISAAVTYGIVVYKTIRASRKPSAKPSELPMPLNHLADENLQYMRTFCSFPVSTAS